ncbi:hypothetical protein QT381_01515 [Galbitalea sp. SE-J8]|uniref:hypothetical protein n=1 Tax=Galbitalea sp. SE-J8 TaxID=3054952 RepID=UPI00259D1F6E|nr:hypothetical protein [Galbitalea sp. SE-J8]MDM4761682.1 hypothetical protein [Galbitalea sp. SE-J8]
MQLGTRWSPGATPPPRLPAAVVETIASIEADLAPDVRATWRWTLTWLEGRPVVEADPSTGSARAGIRVLYDPASDTAVVLGPDDVEDA